MMPNMRLTMFCPRCGAAIPDQARFCYKCGTSLEPGTPDARELYKSESKAQAQARVSTDTVGVTFEEGIDQQGNSWWNKPRSLAWKLWTAFAWCCAVFVLLILALVATPRSMQAGAAGSVFSIANVALVVGVLVIVTRPKVRRR